MRPLCIYHATCLDGFTAAWIVRRYSAGETDLHAARHGDPPPDVAGREVTVVDFSYPRAVMEGICDEAEGVLVLDHHKTAIEDLAGLERPNLTMVLDDDRSGAGIAWDWFHGGAPRPDFVDAVEDRDLWRFALPHTAEIMAAVQARPFTVEAWDQLYLTPSHWLVSEGRAILRYRDNLVDLACQNVRRLDIGGHDVPVVNCVYSIGSDVAGRLAEGEPFAAYYTDLADRRLWGLRSTPEGADVSVVAAAYGGGGHRHASGFRTGLDEWP